MLSTSSTMTLFNFLILSALFFILVFESGLLVRYRGLLTYVHSTCIAYFVNILQHLLLSSSLLLI